MKTVPRLHLISNRDLCTAEEFPRVARSAATGGVEAVHLREPGLKDSELETLVLKTRQMLAGSSALVLVNGNVMVAVSAGADGLHLPEAQTGQLVTARGLFPADAIIGVSVHSLEAARAAEVSGADYVIAGHVFESSSKPGTAGRGLSFIQEIAVTVSIPVIGIGGITTRNASEVLRSGAHGVAVLSGILSSSDAEATSRRYRYVIERGRSED